ncbi:hypothetical protein ACIRST_20080 [Kitasatospora sp. NPDC101447]|uniref:hypothetical protein n=1 Tax=Kitasatospora sp. NPDC101447 TaxID=3364102 RepID=UPI00381300B8
MRYDLRDSGTSTTVDPEAPAYTLREIPGARLLVLERAETAIPDAAAEEIAAAMLTL